jgi:hypothetical protein
MTRALLTAVLVPLFPVPAISFAQTQIPSREDNIWAWHDDQMAEAEVRQAALSRLTRLFAGSQAGRKRRVHDLSALADVAESRPSVIQQPGNGAIALHPPGEPRARCEMAHRTNRLCILDAGRGECVAVIVRDASGRLWTDLKIMEPLL